MTSQGSHTTDETTRSMTPSQNNEEARHLAETTRVHDTKPVESWMAQCLAEGIVDDTVPRTRRCVMNLARIVVYTPGWLGLSSPKNQNYRQYLHMCHGVRLLCSRAQGHVRRTGEGLGRELGGDSMSQGRIVTTERSRRGRVCREQQLGEDYGR